jgi:hypothetical protein
MRRAAAMNCWEYMAEETWDDPGKNGKIYK